MYMFATGKSYFKASYDWYQKYAVVGFWCQGRLGYQIIKIRLCESV